MKNKIIFSITLVVIFILYSYYVSSYDCNKEGGCPSSSCPPNEAQYCWVGPTCGSDGLSNCGPGDCCGIEDCCGGGGGNCEDSDGDTYGNNCGPGNDCNDGNRNIWQTRSCFIDNDGDGYGTGSAASVCKGASCSSPAGHTAQGGDCNDNDPNIKPGSANPYCNCDDADGKVFSVETCDGDDNNCNGIVDEGFDRDGDTYTSCGGDCNDNDVSIYPNAQETCDDIDRNCDGDPYGGVDPDLCRQICTHTWIEHPGMCCGDDVDENAKRSEDFCSIGCCPENTCYDSSMRCVASGTYLAGRFCYDGAWISKSNIGMVALSDYADYNRIVNGSLFCGAYQEALNSYDYPILQKFAREYFEGSCFKLDMEEPCAGDVCVLEYDGKAILSGSLNFKPSHAELKQFTNYGGNCANALDTVSAGIKPCNSDPDQLWFDSLTGVYVYGSDNISLRTSLWEQYLRMLDTSYSVDKAYAYSINPFSEKQIIGRVSSTCDSGVAEQQLNITYVNAGTSICPWVSSISGGTCTADANNETINSAKQATEGNVFFDLWQALTSKLRLR